MSSRRIRYSQTWFAVEEMHSSTVRAEVLNVGDDCSRVIKLTQPEHELNLREVSAITVAEDAVHIGDIDMAKQKMELRLF